MANASIAVYKKVIKSNPKIAELQKKYAAPKKAIVKKDAV